MTLLVCCGGSYVSGMEIVELAVMRGLAARGHRVHALVNGWNDGDFIARLELAGIPYTEAFVGKLTVRRPRWMLDTLRFLPGARRTVRRLMRDLRPDLVMASNRDAVLLLSGLFGDTEVVYRVHEPLSETWTRRIGRRATRFITVSDFIRSLLISNGLAPDRVVTAQNGVEAAAPVRPSNEPPVIGICGQVGAWKGHDDLFDAAGRLGARGIPFELRVYGRGDDDYVTLLKARAEADEVSKSVRWMGFERDIERMYADLDILAVPSRSNDPFPTTVLEAGGREIPVVGTRRGGIPEMIEDGMTGLLVRPEDPVALADALQSLLQDPDRRRAMGVSARRRIEARFLTEHMVDRVEAALFNRP